jgi:hypothetical protein
LRINYTGKYVVLTSPHARLSVRISIVDSYLIPIAILMVLSIPPVRAGNIACALCTPTLTNPQLFGQQVVLIFIGLTWGLKGLGIAAAGAIFGELITFLHVPFTPTPPPCLRPVLSLCKSLLRNRAAKIEVDNLQYAIFARVIRNGGLRVAIIARYSVIPSHCEPPMCRT